MKRDDEVMRQGVRRLRDLMPAARAAVAKNDSTYEARSAIGESQIPYITEDNLSALVIYRAPLGGWHCDLRLKQVPPGIPNAFGTPVQAPCATLREAEDRARVFLQLALSVAAENSKRPAAAGRPVFVLQGWELPLNPHLLKILESLLPEQLRTEEHRVFSLRRVKEEAARLCPGGFDPEQLITSSVDDQARLMTAIHIASIRGHFRYPDLVDQPPPGPASETKH